LKAIDPDAEIAPNTITKKLEENNLFRKTISTSNATVTATAGQ
jgi:hypothetical protein